MYLDKEKGPSHAREWALNMKFDKTQLKELGTHIRIEFKRRGLVSK